jgi:muramidase (phage lysozyme)
LSTYKGKDDCTDIILDMIAVHESNGNYNALIGNANSKADLSRYTLAEIYELMKKLLTIGEPSTAIGRYQIIKATLRTLQTKKGLPDTTKFTPELQDQLAVSLMVGRGYPAWWDGRITDAEFLHGLSCEWASLPDPNANGKSHYDGVGPNHAGTTLAWVYAALRRAKGAERHPPATTPPQTPPPVPAATAAAPGGILSKLKGLFS